MPAQEATFPVVTGQAVTADWLNAMGMRQIYDSTAAGVAFPAASIGISNLSTAYTNLLLVYTARTNLAASSVDYLAWRANGSSAAAYYTQELFGNTAALTAAEAIGATSGRCGYVTATNAVANAFADGYCRWTQYNDPTIGGLQSYIFGHGGAGAIYGVTNALTRVGNFHFYYGAPVLTSLTFFGQGGGSFVSGTRFTLYGET